MIAHPLVGHAQIALPTCIDCKTHMPDRDYLRGLSLLLMLAKYDRLVIDQKHSFDDFGNIRSDC